MYNQAVDKYTVKGMIIILKLIWRILSMCELSWYILIRSLQLTAVLLFCSFMLNVASGGSMAEHYSLIMTARELFSLPQGILLVAAIAGVCIEDITLR